MKILILGGTGAMGRPLTSILSLSKMNVYVTSRYHHEDEDNIHYIKGNAHEINFLKEILKNKYDVIIDFMIYQVSEFQERVNLFLNSTNQYIFLSSSRVYANCDGRITESSPRLLDISKDKEYLSTDDYSLTKAREENLLFDSGKKNWTIIRPYITYESNRLQLGIYEKDLWLTRVLQNKTIVVPRSLLNCKTTLTFGKDVSSRISMVVGNNKFLGETINITSNQFATWQQIIDMYSKEIIKLTGKKPKIIYSDNSEFIATIMKSYYQLKYDRLFNRTFDNSKIEKMTNNNNSYVSLDKGLRDSIKECLNKKEFSLNGSWVMRAYMDKVSGERENIRDIHSLYGKIKYLIVRYTPYLEFMYGQMRNIKGGG
ncbi:hypothetical protein [Companilactobacillus nantensis]|uniref:hypothetical protein n=1 Tax=Companilactobacillus nantensis TaxID=305793 RepID=UPI0011BD8258|nr:hypothetical protein [Companilactobacillus nantensis]